MRLWRTVLYGMLALVLAGGWGFLFWQSSDSNLAAGNTAGSALTSLRAIDGRWNDQLVGVRQAGGQGTGFEPASHGSAMAQLEGQALRLPHPGLGTMLGAVKQAFDDKAALMKRVAAGEPLFNVAWLAPTGPRLDALSRMLDRATAQAVRALARERRFEALETQLKDGLHGIGRIAELVANLKDFSRLDRGRVAQVDLHEGIESTLRIAQHQIGKRTVKKSFGEIPRVTCSPSQINQVLLNLVVNAAQATPEAGRHRGNPSSLQVS